MLHTVTLQEDKTQKQEVCSKPIHALFYPPTLQLQMKSNGSSCSEVSQHGCLKLDDGLLMEEDVNCH